MDRYLLELKCFIIFYSIILLLYSTFFCFEFIYTLTIFTDIKLQVRRVIWWYRKETSDVRDTFEVIYVLNNYMGSKTESSAM